MNYEVHFKKHFLDRFSFLQTKEIYVFGAGYMGRLVVENLLLLGLSVQKIIDNDASKYNSVIEEISICSLEEFIQLKSQNAFIILAIEKYQEVIKQLEDAGISRFIYESVYETIYNETIEANTQLEQVLNELLKREYRDINLQMQKEALVETAQFVADNMFDVKQYDDRSILIRDILSEPRINGSYLEFGVFKGNSINYISSLLPSETVYGFDSFEGLPEFWFPGFEKGTFNSQGILPEVNSNVQLVKGWFDETIPQFLTKHSQNCAFIHIDCDLYSSTKTIFNELKHLIVSGTIILFDEYFNYVTWKNAEHKAFMEFIEETGFSFEYIGFVSKISPGQVAVRITST
ncbi:MULTISPECIES: class I SAM-dependent methyltransferase [unclassified Paenibacillus]|nr:MULTISPECIES: class I SAM-dependent methyltransferase [unclassified Paenibacillus]MDF9839746.1 hypothetical protein [Paenibacillus sp. PastF-2]MDF9846326.1 hypothetical protein [Paenibacillus sp. PastM-2]MDF9853324.1 hypothetical protein [Paenibacillus sp. PastF-1]MDH6478172.1 hypothetical protein [Paenibacillus sp. PastH-2]